MKRSTIALIAAGSTLLILIAGLYFFVIRPRLALIEIEPTGTVTEVPAAEKGRNAVLNLFFHAPLPLSGIARMELTLTAIDAVDDDGETTSVFDGSRRITVQQDIVQKISSARMFNGHVDHLILTFGPTASVLSSDGSIQTAFLPDRTLAVFIDKDIPAGRSLDALIALPAHTAFGEDGGVITLELPASTEAETYILGGIFLDERSVGEVYRIPGATLHDAILADIGLDIAPREDLKGSTGFGAPEESQPIETTP